MKAKFYERLMTAAMIGCVVFASGVTFTTLGISVCCAAVAAMCSKKLESYGKYQ
jgi:hypothetical protein